MLVSGPVLSREQFRRQSEAESGNTTQFINLHDGHIRLSRSMSRAYSYQALLIALIAWKWQLLCTVKYATPYFSALGIINVTFAPILKRGHFLAQTVASILLDCSYGPNLRISVLIGQSRDALGRHYRIIHQNSDDSSHERKRIRVSKAQAVSFPEGSMRWPTTMSALSELQCGEFLSGASCYPGASQAPFYEHRVVRQDITTWPVSWSEMADLGPWWGATTDGIIYMGT